MRSALASTSDDLLVYRTIQAIDPEKLQHLVQETLGPVLALDAKIRAKLIDTIEATHLYHRTKAAKALGLGVRALDKRRSRIEELTGLHLDLPADRLRLDLALYALRLQEGG